MFIHGGINLCFALKQREEEEWEENYNQILLQDKCEYVIRFSTKTLWYALIKFCNYNFYKAIEAFSTKYFKKSKSFQKI